MTAPRTTTLHYIWWLDDNMWRHTVCRNRCSADTLRNALWSSGYDQVQICEGTPDNDGGDL
ncbi:hypothetical protein SEA_GUDMIT_54 [Gordonia phage Gudmit]|nr:hypothetical protein SEA_GUDMIT_54 [Gordonia phage Gudmit]